MLICKVYRHNCTLDVIYLSQEKEITSNRISRCLVTCTYTQPSQLNLQWSYWRMIWTVLYTWPTKLKGKKQRRYTTLLATAPHCMVPYYLYFRKSDGWGIYAPCFSSGDGNNATEIPTSFSLLRRDLNLCCLGAFSASSNSSASSKSLTGVVRRVVFEGGVLKAKWIFSAISACDKKRV